MGSTAKKAHSGRDPTGLSRAVQGHRRRLCDRSQGAPDPGYPQRDGDKRRLRLRRQLQRLRHNQPLHELNLCNVVGGNRVQFSTGRPTLLTLEKTVESGTPDHSKKDLHIWSISVSPPKWAGREWIGRWIGTCRKPEAPVRCRAPTSLVKPSPGHAGQPIVAVFWRLGAGPRGAARRARGRRGKHRGHPRCAQGIKHARVGWMAWQPGPRPRRSATH